VSTGAVLLVAFDLLPWQDAMTAAGKGTEVYFFLVGMMLLAAIARKEGWFGYTGVFRALAEELKQAAAISAHATVWGAGIINALASNLINNLPIGLIAATTTQAAQSSTHITGAILIGVDLGPTLSVTGSPPRSCG
jgi:Na+/H+ antiporter NhaD/arsenite permease-like protein